MHWTNNRQDGARTTAILLGLCHDCHDLSARRTLTLSSVAVHPPKPPFASASLSPASSGYLLLHLDCPYTPCQPVLLLPSLTFIAQLATYTPSIIAKIWTSQNWFAWKIEKSVKDMANRSEGGQYYPKCQGFNTFFPVFMLYRMSAKSMLYPETEYFSLWTDKDNYR